MRVLHVVTAFARGDEDPITPWLGRLLIAQRTAGLDARVLAPTYRGGGAREWRGVPVTRFRYAPRLFETLTHDETVPDRLRSRPAYAALLPGYLLAGAIAAAREAARGLDVVHVHWPVPHALFGAASRAIGGGPAVVSSYYSVEINWIERRLPALAPFLRWSIETADAVTAISTSTAAALRRYVERDVVVIPFAAAIGDDADAPPPRSRTGDAPFRILFVGRLVERKGVEVLIEAAAALSSSLDLRLDVIGSGPEGDRLADAARRHGIADKVTFHGRVGEAGLLAAYRTADVFVLPAVVDSKGDTEGLGVVLLEALREGVPVVASDAGGITDIVQDGVTGWLVPSGDAGALGRALVAVAADPAEAARRVERGREQIERRFSLPGIVTALSECYERARALRLAGPPAV
ncbi:MAG: glycosyltransferase [Gemmatimonadota bacterium]|nr:glycosyltransferase [Gemmatimonadota bacterium]